jgi:hypothetical protein
MASKSVKDLIEGIQALDARLCALEQEFLGGHISDCDGIDDDDDRCPRSFTYLRPGGGDRIVRNIGGAFFIRP